MSAEKQNPSSPSGGGPDGAADATNHAPESVRTGVVTSHGEREKRAYVAPVEVPRRHQRLATIDMSKVRIAPDMKVQQVDPRHMPTTKMDIPPGGIRPLPPPANAEVGDPQSASKPAAGGASPWSHNAGIDRSMLPSAAMAPGGSPQATNLPSVPPPRSQASAGGIGIGVWIAVILVAALMGGGIAYALRSGGSSGSADPVSSSAPIAIAVPTTGTQSPSTEAPSDPEIVDPNSTNAVADAGADASTAKVGTSRVTPRRTTLTPKATTAPAPAPAPTTTTRPRLFN